MVLYALDIRDGIRGRRPPFLRMLEDEDARSIELICIDLMREVLKLMAGTCDRIPTLN